MAAHAFTRAAYTNISKMHFTRRGERSGDMKIGSEFMVVEVYRSKGEQAVVSFTTARLYEPVLYLYLDLLLDFHMEARLVQGAD
jgi:hypothetical protein